MRVALIHDAKFPVSGYGGTERVVWWLAKGLSEKGVDVLLVSQEGSTSPFCKTIPVRDFSERMVDFVHHFNTPAQYPSKPYIVTIGGNGIAGEKYLPNTVFVSENHAKRHGAVAFVHNGLDPEEYQFRELKEKSLTFLAKASWKVKNVKGAIRIARKANKELRILGGRRLFLNKWRNVSWEGTLAGTKKAEMIALSQGLLFPVIWNEPFGIAVTEALVSGTPVLATPFGSLSELIPEQCGRLCKSDAEFLEGIEQLPKYSAQECRDWVLKNFTYRQMTKKYLEYYDKILSGERINPTVPVALTDQGHFLNYPIKDV